jgi:hypothetical protein
MRTCGVDPRYGGRRSFEGKVTVEGIYRFAGGDGE